MVGGLGKWGSNYITGGGPCTVISKLNKLENVWEGRGGPCIVLLHSVLLFLILGVLHYMIVSGGSIPQTCLGLCSGEDLFTQNHILPTIWPLHYIITSL